MSLRDEMLGDLNEIFSTDELAEPVQLRNQAGTLLSAIPAHFLNASDVMALYQVAWDDAKPQATVRLADCTGVNHQWRLLLVSSGKEYRVTSVQKDGEGLVVLHLSED